MKVKHPNHTHVRQRCCCCVDQKRETLSSHEDWRQKRRSEQLKSENKKKKCHGKVNSSNVCSLHRRVRRGQSHGSKPGHYWLFLCSVWLAGTSEGVSPRDALERKSNHLAWCSASWALRRKVCWVWLSRSPCLPSGFSPDDGGITLTSNPGRGTTRAPLES